MANNKKNVQVGAKVGTDGLTRLTGPVGSQSTVLPTPQASKVNISDVNIPSSSNARNEELLARLVSETEVAWDTPSDLSRISMETHFDQAWIKREELETFDKYEAAQVAYSIAKFEDYVVDPKSAKELFKAARAEYDATPEGVAKLKDKIKKLALKGDKPLVSTKIRLENAEERWAEKTMKHNVEVFVKWGEVVEEDVARLFEGSNWSVDGERLQALGEKDINWSECIKEDLISLREKDFQDSKKERFYEPLVANTLAEIESYCMGVEADGPYYDIKNSKGERIGEMMFDSTKPNMSTAYIACDPSSSLAVHPYVEIKGLDNIRKEFEYHYLNKLSWTPAKWENRFGR